MKTINSTYFGIYSMQELIEKIKNYLDDYSEWNYDTQDWEREGFPRWTFSGYPNGDILTKHVQQCCLYGVDYEDYDTDDIDGNGWLSDFSFSDEEDRIAGCKAFAEKIAQTIELE